MLEMHSSPARVRLMHMQRAVFAECRRVHGDLAHATLVRDVVAKLVESCPGKQKRSILVVVHCVGTSTLVMVRDPQDRDVDIDAVRRTLLEAHAIRWSTMRNGAERTIIFDIDRTSTEAPTARASTTARDRVSPAPRPAADMRR